LIVVNELLAQEFAREVEVTASRGDRPRHKGEKGWGYGALFLRIHVSTTIATTRPSRRRIGVSVRWPSSSDVRQVTLRRNVWVTTTQRIGIVALVN
jgi:hypothetical protein